MDKKKVLIAGFSIVLVMLVVLVVLAVRKANSSGTHITEVLQATPIPYGIDQGGAGSGNGTGTGSGGSLSGSGIAVPGRGTAVTPTGNRTQFGTGSGSSRQLPTPVPTGSGGQRLRIGDTGSGNGGVAVSPTIYRGSTGGNTASPTESAYPGRIVQPTGSKGSPVPTAKVSTSPKTTGTSPTRAPVMGQGQIMNWKPTKVPTPTVSKLFRSPSPTQIPWPFF